MKNPSPIEAFRILVEHEASECNARAKSPALSKEWRIAFLHQARGLFHAMEMLDTLLHGQRPMAGIRSRGAYHFHAYGELLPVGGSECFPAVPPNVRLENGSWVKFYAVHELERDEAGVFHLRAVAPEAGVGDVD